MRTLFTRIKLVSDTNPEKDLLLRLAKLQEEAGELAAPTLKLLGYKPRKGETDQELIDNQKEEAGDVLLVAYDILHKIGMTESELEILLDRKLAKWANAINMGKIKKY